MVRLNELPPAVQKSILARKPNNRKSMKMKLSPNTVNRDVGSKKDKKQKVLLKNIRVSIPDATVLYLFHQKCGSSLHTFLPLGF